MGRTLSEQIISQAAGRQVKAGDVVTLAADTVMVHDSIAPSVIRILREQLGCERIPDPDRVAVGIDHVAPASTPATAKAQQGLRAWVREQGIENFFESGRGIAHQVLIEERLARPGRLLVGSDSHSTAYGAVGAFGTGMGATDIALLLATGRVWMRVPATIIVRVTGRFGPGIRPKDLALRLCRRLRSDGATYALLYGLAPAAPFTAIAAVSGVLHPANFGNGNLERASGRRIYLAHGALDWMFPVTLARMARDELQRAGADLCYREIEDLSHAYPREENGRILSWFDAGLSLG